MSINPQSSIVVIFSLSSGVKPGFFVFVFGFLRSISFTVLPSTVIIAVASALLKGKKNTRAHITIAAISAASNGLQSFLLMVNTSQVKMT